MEEKKELKTETTEEREMENIDIVLVKEAGKSGPKTLASYLGMRVPQEMKGTKREIENRVKKALAEASNRLQKLGKQPLPERGDDEGIVYAQAGLFRDGYRPIAFSPAIKGVANLLGQNMTVLVVESKETMEDFEI